MSTETDKCFVSFVRRLFKADRAHSVKLPGISDPKKWNRAFRSAVVSFSDQQIITGLAILINGFFQLSCRGLAVYHWQIVVDLAWFSSVTHLTTLTCLRTYFKKRHVLGLIRTVCMVVIAGLLGCALWSTGYLNDFDSSVDLTFPAWCLYHSDTRREQFGEINYNVPYIAIALTFLGFSYVSRILHILKFGKGFLLSQARSKVLAPICIITKQLRNKISMCSKTMVRDKAIGAQGARIFWILSWRMIWSISLVVQAVSDFYMSVAWEVHLSMEQDLRNHNG